MEWIGKWISIVLISSGPEKSQYLIVPSRDAVQQ